MPVKVSAMEIGVGHDGATRQWLRHAGFQSGCRFVEFGCGMGYVTRWAAEEGATATGIDVNEEQVKASQALADAADLKNVDFHTGNIYSPEFPPDSVDVAYCRWVMVHLNRPVDAMRAIYKILKPGGVMVCEEAGVGAVYAEPRSAAYEEMRDKYNEDLAELASGSKILVQPTKPAAGASTQPSPGFIRDPKTGVIRKKLPGE